MSETIIHPETGAILRRRKRMETVTYQGQSRTVEVEGWFPDDEGDGILVGADSKPLDAALAEMKAGWPDPARPGVPLNPERDGWHWLKTGRDGLIPWYWVEDQGNEGCFGWETEDDIYSAENMAFGGTSYLGPCLTPAEVETHIRELKAILAQSTANLVTQAHQQARRDALEEAALWHDEQERFWMEKGREVSKFDMRIGLDLHLKAGDHRKHAAAIRALKGEGDD